MTPITTLSTAFTSVVLFALNVQANRPGATLCVTGYVMDGYTIELGVLPTKTESDTELSALQFPEKLPVASLVDNEVNVNSGFYILKEPTAEEQYRQTYRLEAAEYTVEWKLSNHGEIVDLVREVGICSTCYGSGYMQTGFKVEIVGMIMSFYPPTLEVKDIRTFNPEKEACVWHNSPSPTKRPTDLPSASPTESPTISPTEKGVTWSPSASPTQAPTKKPTEKPTISPSSRPSVSPSVSPTKNPTGKPSKVPTGEPTTAPSSSPSSTPSAAPSVAPPVNCSEYQETFHVPDMPITIHYVVNEDEYSGESTLSAQVVYSGQGWLGIGISPDGAMNGSSVVIGSVASSDDIPVNPGKYNLGGPAQSFITPMDSQTLLDDSIVQNSSHTVLTFTKLLEEEGELSIKANGVNTFIVAHGFTNTFAYHEGRTSFQLSLFPCIPTIEEKTIDHFVYINATLHFNKTSNETEDTFSVEIEGGLEDGPIPFDGTNENIGLNLMNGRTSGSNKPADAYANANANNYGDYAENVSAANGVFASTTALLGLALCFFM